MRNLKKSTLFLALLFALVMVFSLACFAEEAPAVDPPAESEPQAPEEAPQTPPADENSSQEGSQYITIFNRVWEYVQLYVNEIFGALGLVFMAILAAYQKVNKNSSILGFSKVLKGQTSVVHASDENTAATKEMVKSQGEMLKYYKENVKNEQEKNKVTSALLVEVMSLIEIMHIICLNNANMPQAIKDLVTSKHARCLSVINDDAELKAAYENMREVLGIQKSEVSEDGAKAS